MNRLHSNQYQNHCQILLALLVGQDMLDIVLTESDTMQTHALTFDPAQFRRDHECRTLAKDQQAFQVAVRILDAWAFTDIEKSIVLGDIPITTFRRMKVGNMSNMLNVDRSTRLSLILGIHKSLRIMFLQSKHQLEWVNNPNRALGQYSPKDIMLSGALVGLHDIRRYLDAART